MARYEFNLSGSSDGFLFLLFQSHDILGRGASKDVYRAYDLEEGIEVAWNEVSLTDLPKSVKESIIK